MYIQSRSDPGAEIQVSLELDMGGGRSRNYGK